MRILAMLGTTLLLGCSGVPPVDSGPSEAAARPAVSRYGHELKTVDGLSMAHESRFGALYVHPDHHIGSYDELQIDPFTVSYKQGQRPLSSEGTRKLRDTLEAGLRESIEADGLVVREEAGLCTVAIQVHLADLELNDIDGDSGASTSFIASAGTVMLIFELRDSTTRTPLVRYGQRRSLPGGKTLGVSGALSTRGLGSAVDALMRDVGREIALYLPDTEKVREVDCEGKLFEVGERKRG